MDPLTLERIAACTARDQALLRMAEDSRAEYGSIVEPEADKLTAIRAVVEAMQKAGLDYALIGGVAVGLQSGVPRATLDVDIAAPTYAPCGQLHAVLSSLGFQAMGFFAHSRNYRHEGGQPVQFVFDAEFDVFIERAEVMKLRDFELRVVTKEDLIAMKRRAASDPTRPRSKALRDQADIALLLGDVPDDDEGW